MTERTESVVLCEGYYDRAFWAGWLTHLGCTDPGEPPKGQTGRQDVPDPWGIQVTGGVFAFHSKSGRFIRVIPCRSKQNVMIEARNQLIQRTTRAKEHLVLNTDADTHVDAKGTPSGGYTVDDLLREIQRIDTSATRIDGNDIGVDGGETRISLVRWQAPEEPLPGAPGKQTLERLVCVAIVQAYPKRAEAVKEWLASRPAPPKDSPKEYAWSYMAGWYADHGCDDFYRGLWRDEKIVKPLTELLRQCSALRVAEALAS